MFSGKMTLKTVTGFFYIILLSSCSWYSSTESTTHIPAPNNDPSVSSATISARDQALQKLYRREEELLAKTDFIKQKSSDETLGTNPAFLLWPAALPSGLSFLQGTSEAVSLFLGKKDGEIANVLSVMQHLPAPNKTSSVVYQENTHTVYAADLLSSSIYVYQYENDPQQQWAFRKKIDVTQKDPIHGIQALALYQHSHAAHDEVNAGGDAYLFWAENAYLHIHTLNTAKNSTKSTTTDADPVSICQFPAQMEIVSSPADVDQNQKITEDRLLIRCPIEHRVDIYRILKNDTKKAPTVVLDKSIVHDGPIWSMQVNKNHSVDKSVNKHTEYLVALGGIENHPLDRSEGFFGNIDSFVFLYDMSTGRQVWSENLSAFGIVTPKSLLWSKSLTQDCLDVFAAGSDTTARFCWDDLTSANLPQTPHRNLQKMPLNSSSVVLRQVTPQESVWITTHPVMDGWAVTPILAQQSSQKPAPATRQQPHPFVSTFFPSRTAKQDDVVDTPERALAKLGEALIFSSLMAPKNKTDGIHSVFSCEACHLDGGIDGRTHNTGRTTTAGLSATQNTTDPPIAVPILATTKPLFGLWGNRPYFSRALDKNLATVAHAEFRAAGGGSNTDPWFDLDKNQYPWMAFLDPQQHLPQNLDGALLRNAVLVFLRDFTAPRNKLHVSNGKIHDVEAIKNGAKVFSSICLRCHDSRTQTDRADTRNNDEASWLPLLTNNNAPFTFASEGYQQVGITPWMHETGTRTPSLRRVFDKYPYFTDGSGKSIEDVLRKIRVDRSGSLFLHNADHVIDPEIQKNLQSLSDEEIRLLLAFLQVL